MGLNTFDLIRLTSLSLRGNPLRSGLTTLGVFMGVTAVSATLQVGTISGAVVARQLEEREAPQIRVYPEWKPGADTRFQLDDLEYLQHRLQDVRAISTLRGFWSDQPVLFQDRTANPDRYAVAKQYWELSGRARVAGRYLSAADFDNYRSVVVIDGELAKQLFQGEDPIGQRIYDRGHPYVVVGVVESKLQYSEQEPQGTLFLPLSVDIALTGRLDLWSISIRPQSLEEMEKIEKQAIALLEQRFPGQEFGSWSNVNDIIEQQQTLIMVGRALLAVGGIALLVGGVGIANITIASVMERTKEIGLRLAIGATPRDILLQFVLEAVFLSLLGGTVAIGTVHGLTVVVSKTFELPYEFDSNSALLALSSAVLVGVGAGFFPALRASQLDPVAALRS